MAQVIPVNFVFQRVNRRAFFQLPDQTVAHQLRAPEDEGRDAQTVVPLNEDYGVNDPGIATVVAGKGIVVTRGGVYTVELQDFVQFTSHTDPDIEFGWVIFHYDSEDNVKETYIHGDIYRLDLPDSVAPLAYAVEITMEAGDYVNFIRSFKGKRRGYTINYTAMNVNIPGTTIPEVDRRFGVYKKEIARMQ